VCRENILRQYRGSDWAVLALGYRLALGVATSIFLRALLRLAGVVDAILACGRGTMKNGGVFQVFFIVPTLRGANYWK